MNILGLDISLRSTGVALLSETVSFTFTIKTKPGISVNQTAVTILNSLSQYLEPETIIFIEDYAFGKFGKSNSVSSIIELTGILQYEFYKMQVVYYKVAPTVVKKFLSGKGVLPKDQIPLLIYKKFNITPDTVDACDALAVADLGYSIITGNGYKRDLKKYELDCLKKT